MPVTSAIKRRSEEHPFIVNNNKILKQEHRHYPNSPPPPPPRTPQPSTSVSSPTPSPTPPSITESPWDTITICGKLYYQVHLIKTGGSSRVYKVLCKETGSIFAMKDIQMGRIDASKFDSYVEEVTLLQQLQGNGCVIRLHDFEMDKRTLKLRMLFEYGDTDLASYIHKNKLDVYDIRHFWRKMVEATRLLHARKIVHSDLKPGNFVIVRGKVKIIDFGIAKAISDGTVNIKRQTINGTPNYIAPEALSDLFECNQHRFMREEDEDEDDEFKRELYKVGPPADIWALGIILYQMVYGNTPFHNHPNKDNAIRNEPVNFPPKSRNGEHIPPELENAMEWCLKKEAKDRPTAEQLLRHQFLRS
ncbi:kinase-like domain-containing protein [Phascolomyces articulosus]|uniref:Kinase-like domain-containing protein n=1 Tax=Phascolomyces articulosus TaxID=60185 RepID=A0AAD5K1N6_9FUNG|nr:kinase-like domain-containing protein [Phascolomyces articulosus]